MSEPHMGTPPTQPPGTWPSSQTGYVPLLLVPQVPGQVGLPLTLTSFQQQWVPVLTRPLACTPPGNQMMQLPVMNALPPPRLRADTLYSDNDMLHPAPTTSDGSAGPEAAHVDCSQQSQDLGSSGEWDPINPHTQSQSIPLCLGSQDGQSMVMWPAQPPDSLPDPDSVEDQPLPTHQDADQGEDDLQPHQHPDQHQYGAQLAHQPTFRPVAGTDRRRAEAAGRPARSGLVSADLDGDVVHVPCLSTTQATPMPACAVPTAGIAHAPPVEAADVGACRGGSVGTGSHAACLPSAELAGDTVHFPALSDCNNGASARLPGPGSPAPAFPAVGSPTTAGKPNGAADELRKPGPSLGQPSPPAATAATTVPVLHSNVPSPSSPRGSESREQLAALLAFEAQQAQTTQLYSPLQAQQARHAQHDEASSPNRGDQQAAELLGAQLPHPAAAAQSAAALAAAPGQPLGSVRPLHCRAEGLEASQLVAGPGHMLTCCNDGPLAPSELDAGPGQASSPPAINFLASGTQGSSGVEPTGGPVLIQPKVCGTPVHLADGGAQAAHGTHASCAGGCGSSAGQPLGSPGGNPVASPPGSQRLGGSQQASQRAQHSAATPGHHRVSWSNKAPRELEGFKAWCCYCGSGFRKDELIWRPCVCGKGKPSSRCCRQPWVHKDCQLRYNESGAAAFPTANEPLPGNLSLSQADIRSPADPAIPAAAGGTPAAAGAPGPELLSPLQLMCAQVLGQTSLAEVPGEVRTSFSPSMASIAAPMTGHAVPVAQQQGAQQSAVLRHRMQQSLVQQQPLQPRVLTEAMAGAAGLQAQHAAAQFSPSQPAGASAAHISSPPFECVSGGPEHQRSLKRGVHARDGCTAAGPAAASASGVTHGAASATEVLASPPAAAPFGSCTPPSAGIPPPPEAAPGAPVRPPRSAAEIEANRWEALRKRAKHDPEIRRRLQFESAGANVRRPEWQG